VVLWSLGGTVPVVAYFVMWEAAVLWLGIHFVMWEAAVLWLDIHHTQEISVHQWSTQPSTKQHPTAARHHAYLNNL
jgi:arginine exporter protein ArgO